MEPSPTQFIALCVIFLGIHVVALPAFVWALRRGQFRGREQSEWHLDDQESPSAPLAFSLLMKAACEGVETS